MHHYTYLEKEEVGNMKGRGRRNERTCRTFHRAKGDTGGRKLF